MCAHRIFYVTTGKPKYGKAEAAARWWVEKGRKQFEAKPGTKSVQTYIVQLGLGGEAFPLEIWQELESYAALDQWVQEAQFAPSSLIAFITEFHEYYDLGPCRIMDEWPGGYPDGGAR